MNNFERKFGKFSITNLTAYIIIGRVFFLILSYISPETLELFTLDIEAIMHGQVWRILTYMFIPNSNLFWFFFEVMFLYWIGTGLEQEWGSFRYTLYMLGSVLGVGLASVILYFMPGQDLTLVTLGGYLISSFFTYTLFLPFAWYYGEEEIRFMLMITIKVKYLGIIDLVLLIMTLANAYSIGGLGLLMVLLFSMVNMIVFFAVVFARRGKQKARLAGFKGKISKTEKKMNKNAIHRCSVCGITEKDDPNMTFRYCSKCEGDYEFCEKHLKDHEHFKKVVEFKKEK